MNMKLKSKSSVHKLLEQKLSVLGYTNSLKALDLVVYEMSAEKGFSRHNGEDYFEHLIEVTNLLLNHGYREENLLTSALLHDIVEDVEGYTIKMVEKGFGKEVSETVGLVTKTPGIDYKSDDNEMVKYLQNIYLSRYASLVKTADRIHNFITLGGSSVKHRQGQVNNTLNHFIPFFKACRQNYVRDASFFYEAKMIIEPIALEIGKNNQQILSLEDKVSKQNQEIGRLKELIEAYEEETDLEYN